MRKEAPEEADVPDDHRDQPKQIPGSGMAVSPSIAGHQQRDRPRNHIPHEQGRDESDPEGNALPFRWYLIGILSCVHDISLYLSIVTKHGKEDVPKTGPPRRASTKRLESTDSGLSRRTWHSPYPRRVPFEPQLPLQGQSLPDKLMPG